MTESYELDYKTFHSLESLKNSHADGYRFSLSFLVFGDREVHVLLAESEQANAEAKPAYEIGSCRVSIALFTRSMRSFSSICFCLCWLAVIGGYGNTHILVRKTVGDDVFEKVQLKDLLSTRHQTRVLIRMTNGKIAIATTKLHITIHITSLYFE